MRLKYDDTDSDQKFSESELYPLIVGTAHVMPTKRQRKARCPYLVVIRVS